MSELTNSLAWQQLLKMETRLARIALKDLLAAPDRFPKFSLDMQGLLLDYSHQHIDQQSLDCLFKLAEQQGVSPRIDDLFAGRIVDSAKQKAGGHHRLRHVSYQQTEDFNNLIRYATCLRERQWKGVSGKPITAVIHVGIGGSQIGPKLACESLAHFSNDELTIYFIDSFDTWLLKHCLQQLSPDTTLICVASKSFATAETLANAEVLREWQPAMHHWLAITNNDEVARAWGIENILHVPADVSGRFSIWSSMALPMLLKVGVDNYLQFLSGAAQIDTHFQQATFAENIPVILALLEIWNINFRGCQNQAIIPYDSRLCSFKDYLQQLSMESLGKSVDRNGNSVDYKTGCIVWGGVGSNAQHSFMQLLLQGTLPVATDFVMTHEAVNGPVAKKASIVNALAYMSALAQGNDADNNFERVVGGQPSTALILPKLDPFNLGRLLAIYEHKIYVQSVIWNINAFDQFGVELGKRLSLDFMTGKKDPIALARYLMR